MALLMPGHTGQQPLAPQGQGGPGRGEGGAPQESRQGRAAQERLRFWTAPGRVNPPCGRRAVRLGGPHQSLTLKSFLLSNGVRLNTHTHVCARSRCALAPSRVHTATHTQMRSQPHSFVRARTTRGRAPMVQFILTWRSMTTAEHMHSETFFQEPLNLIARRLVLQSSFLLSGYRKECYFWEVLSHSHLMLQNDCH